VCEPEFTVAPASKKHGYLPLEQPGIGGRKFELEKSRRRHVERHGKRNNQLE